MPTPVLRDAYEQALVGKPLKIVPRVSAIHAWTGRDWMTATRRWEARKARIRRNLGDDLIRRLTGV